MINLKFKQIIINVIFGSSLSEYECIKGINKYLFNVCKQDVINIIKVKYLV